MAQLHKWIKKCTKICFLSIGKNVSNKIEGVCSNVELFVRAGYRYKNASWF